MALPKVTKRKKPRAARRVSTGEPKFEGIESLNGQEYCKTYRQMSEYYRLDCKSSDYKGWVVAYCKEHEEFKSKSTIVNKVPDSRFGPSLGCSARLLSRGWPDYHPAYAEYWENLAGTMGEVAPLSTWLDKNIKEIIETSTYKISSLKSFPLGVIGLVLSLRGASCDSPIPTVTKPLTHSSLMPMTSVIATARCRPFRPNALCT